MKESVKKQQQQQNKKDKDKEYFRCENKTRNRRCTFK